MKKEENQIQSHRHKLPKSFFKLDKQELKKRLDLLIGDSFEKPIDYKLLCNLFDHHQSDKQTDIPSRLTVSEKDTESKLSV